MTATKRRDFLAAAAIAGTATLGIAANASAADEDADKPGIENGRIRQSVMGWCFKPMDAVTLAQHCKQIGLQAIEGVGTDAYPAIKALGLEISLVGSHGFKDGPVNADNHAMVEAKLRQGIDTAVKSGAPSVITFTGMREEGLTDKVAIKNCLDCWKRVVPYAEEKGITIVLEHLNSRDNSHPMKGHPGYWGDDLHLCAELVNNIGSERFKLLFDCYHVQIMNGDIIRNLRRYAAIIGHYHTAGNPGRGELDDNQEINYPPIMRAILETGYTGYVAQEFIPTAKDPIDSLRQAAVLCDV